MSAPLRTMLKTMSCRVASLALAAAMLTFAAAPVAAQSLTSAVALAAPAPQRTAYRPPRPRQSLGFRAFVTFDVNALSASQTFDAVVGTSKPNAVGGGAELLNVWRGLFLHVAASKMKESGSRVVVAGGQATPLDIPLTVEMMPIEIGAGWRADVGRRRRVGVYGGGGLLRLGYRESSTFAASDENSDTTFTGGFAFAGADLRVLGGVVVGVEGQIRSVPNAIGDAGASAAFDETNLGGATLRVLAGVKF
jgi:hypothetical protein